MKKFSSITRVNSHHISRDRKIKRIVVLCIIALTLLFVVPKAVSYTASLVMLPVHAVQNWLAVSGDSFPRYIRDRQVLLDEINALTYTQSAQSGDRLTAQLLIQENTELRTLLSDSGHRRILAGVIGRPQTVPYDVLILDKGSDDGIVEGAPVFIGNDAVIGTVSKVFNKSAVVTLITTPHTTVSVYIMGPNIYTNAVGIGGGQLRVGVPQGIKLEVGNLVILPGVEAGVYGAISTVESTPTQPEQYGYVSPEIPLASLRLVSVGEVSLKPVTFEEAQRIVTETKESLLVVPIPEGVLVTTESSTTSASTTQQEIPTP